MRIDPVNVSMNPSQSTLTSNVSGKRMESQPKTELKPDNNSQINSVKQESRPGLEKQEGHQLNADPTELEEKVAQQEHEVIQAIEKANKHIRTYDRRLEFSIHETTKQIMVKVINTEDDSIIREIPSEKVLDMVGHLWEVAGILVDEHR